MTVNVGSPAIPAPAMLEPRIMMDANLDWDLASTTALSGSLSGLVQAFAEQYATIDEFETPDSNWGNSVGVALGTYSGPAHKHGGFDDLLSAAERVELAFSDLRSAVMDQGAVRQDSGFGEPDVTLLSIPGSGQIGDEIAVCDPDVGGGEDIVGVPPVAVCGPDLISSGGFIDLGETISLAPDTASSADIERVVVRQDSGFGEPDVTPLSIPGSGQIGDEIAVCDPDVGGGEDIVDLPPVAVCGPDLMMAGGFIDLGETIPLALDTASAEAERGVVRQDSGFGEPDVTLLSIPGSGQIGDEIAVCDPDVGGGEDIVGVPPVAVCGPEFGDANHFIETPPLAVCGPGLMRVGGFIEPDTTVAVCETGTVDSPAGPLDGMAICDPDPIEVEGPEGHWGLPTLSEAQWRYIDGILPAWLDESLRHQVPRSDEVFAGTSSDNATASISERLTLPQLENPNHKPIEDTLRSIGLYDLPVDAAEIAPPTSTEDEFFVDLLAFSAPALARAASVHAGIQADVAIAKSQPVDIERVVVRQDSGFGEPDVTPLSIPGSGQIGDKIAVCDPDVGVGEDFVGVPPVAVCGPEFGDTNHFIETPSLAVCGPGLMRVGGFIEPDTTVAVCETGTVDSPAGPLDGMAICDPDPIEVEGPEGHWGLPTLSEAQWRYIDGILPAWLDESLRHQFDRSVGDILPAYFHTDGNPVPGNLSVLLGGTPDGTYPELGTNEWYAQFGIESGETAATGNPVGTEGDGGATASVINGVEDFNVLRLLNDPSGLLGGIYDIFLELDSFFDDYLSGINLPIVGDALGSGLTFFDNVMNSVILPALEYAETPLEDGSFPTTVQLLNGFVNDALNDVFGTEDEKFLEVFLDTSGSTSDSFIYGALNFSGKLFSEMLDIDFDFGIPGFNIEVEEGSEILLELNYTINIGFGFDIDGFFLLNDTDEAEVSIDFLVDAGTFSGSMSVLNLLGLSAKAVTTDDDGVIISDATTDGGTARLTAFLEADLFGETGDEIERDFSNISPVDGEGNELGYERIIYLSAIDYSELVLFDFGAEIDVNIGVVGNVLDPFSGDALTIGGNEILPNVAAELVLKGSYTIVDGLTVDALGINNVRVDASQLYDALIRPIVDPIMAIVGPLLEVIDVIFQDPIGLVKDLAVDLIAVWFPIIKLGDNVAEIANSIAQFVVDLADAGGMVQFGSFDFTGHADGLVSGETSATDIDLSTLDRSGLITDDGSGGFGTFGDVGDGFSVDIPLIQDPFAALSLLLGDFSGVDLARARYTWFNIDADALDISEQLIDSLDVSDTIKDALRLLESGVGIRNEINGTGVTQFEVGYDMSGIENFLNSYDPFRLFDGVFIEASEGSLVDIDMTITIFASALIASIGGGGDVDIEFNITDPNDDGKVRISELLDAILYMVKQGAITPHQQIAYLLEGHINFDLFVEATFLGIPTTLYELSIPPLELELYNPEPSLVSALDSARFGVLSLQGLLDLLGAGGGDDEVGTQVLNLGARIAASNTDMIIDGNDLVVLGSVLNRYLVSLTNSEGNLEGEIDGNAKAVIIPAGEGDNVIDMTHFGDPDSNMVTITYTGAGQDTITLPVGGVNVVFAGNGDDVITAPPGAQGTYIIFSEGGADNIDIPGGNVIVLSGDDYGMRDVFLTQFAAGNVSADAVRALLGLNDDDTISADADGYYNTGGSELVNLATLVENYTEISQLKADHDVETVTVGSGNHVILTGKGDDIIRGDLDGDGEVVVLSGAGDDDIAIGGTTVYVEGGAGADTIQVNGEDVEVWGWGKAAGENGGVGMATEIDALAQNDGADIIIGGDGDDRLYGQGGDDLIEGNGGNDTIGGGLGNDVIAGGTFAFTVDGTARDIRDVNLRANIPGQMDIRILDRADGNDTIRGGMGNDILLGGGGADSINGAGGLDLIAGDFASVLVTGNMVARHISSLFTDSSRQGGDMIDGGAMDDILLGGGAGDQMIAASGNNILLGDFGSIDGENIREAVTQITSINGAAGGNDILTTGRGNDRLVGGEGDDILNSGLGVDFLFGDNANMDYAARTFTALALDTDGNDTLVLGENLGGALPAPVDLDDFVFGGLGDDTITAGIGGLTLLADAGEMRLRADALAALAAYEDPGQSPSAQVLAQAQAAWFLFDTMVEEARTFADARDGNDHVTVAGGTNTMALGGGDDRAELLDGLNHLLADDGILRTSPTADGTSVVHEMISTAMAAASGRDYITAGDGNNVVIGGDQGDVFEMGDGFNLIIGDRGSFLTSNDQTNGHLRSDTSLIGGDDRITTGAGNAIIIGGQGDDIISVGAGDDVATGDDADITHTQGWDILDLTTLHHASGGNDSLTAENTRGDNVLIGQTGDDRLDGGLNDDLLAGDNGDLEFMAPDLAFAAQSGLDRFVRFESVIPGVDGDDLIYGHDGTDYLVGGFGEEALYGGRGQDFLIGDTAIMTRAYTLQAGGIFGELWIDTNFAFETGGYDRLFGEAGFDVMIGNLGPDLFFGDTEEDALFSDGFAGYFTTDWDSRLFAQSTPHWQLVQVNFAGPGAIDIVSKAQSSSAIGLSLDRLPEDSSRSEGPDMAAKNAVDFYERSVPSGTFATHLDTIMDYVLSDLLMSTIAELMSMGLEGDALRDAIAAELGLFASQSLQVDAMTRELLLERVMTIIEDRLGLNDGEAVSRAPEPQILVAAE